MYPYDMIHEVPPEFGGKNTYVLALGKYQPLIQAVNYW
jgi:hypothetical protein